MLPPSPLINQTACKPGSVGREVQDLRLKPRARRPFLCDAGCPAPEATYPDGDPDKGWGLFPVPSLFGLAPGGVCRAVSVAGNAVRSYRTVSPLPRLYATRRGGLFSVALSLGLPPPDVIRHRLSVEPGLSSPATFR